MGNRLPLALCLLVSALVRISLDACLRPGAVTSRLTTPVAWVQAALTTLPLVEGNRAVGTRLGPYLPARD